MAKEGEAQTVDDVGRATVMRYVALVALVIQTVGAVFVGRESNSRGRVGEGYIMATVVAMHELVKIICSALVLLFEKGFSVSAVCGELKAEIWDKPGESAKVGVPAVLYTFQNILLLVALKNLSGAVYQTTYQLKILTTAILSVIILNKKLSKQKWGALLLLTTGVSAIQLAEPKIGGAEGNFVLGLSAVLTACVTSGLSGVYFEKILKTSKASIWVRNIQLAFVGSILAFSVAYIQAGAEIAERGFFSNYNSWTWGVVFLQSAGGLIVAMVLKYADNILKCFGNAIAIVITCSLSYAMSDFTPTVLSAAGALGVVAATYLYSFDISWSSLVVRMFGANAVFKRVAKNEDKNIASQV